MRTTLIPQPWTVYYAVHAYVCLLSFLETFRLSKINAVIGSEGYNILGCLTNEVTQAGALCNIDVYHSMKRCVFVGLSLLLLYFQYCRIGGCSDVVCSHTASSACDNLIDWSSLFL